LEWGEGHEAIVGKCESALRLRNTTELRIFVTVTDTLHSLQLDSTNLWTYRPGINIDSYDIELRII
jgi:hypothetical protein